LAELLVCRVAFLWIEDFLRVIQSAKFVVLRKDNGTGNYRSCKRRHSCFINTCDKAVTFCPKFDLKS